jgi:hypothetical protein
MYFYSGNAVFNDDPFPLRVDRRVSGEKRQKTLDLFHFAQDGRDRKGLVLFAIGRVATFQNSAMF